MRVRMCGDGGETASMAGCRREGGEWWGGSQDEISVSPTIVCAESRLQLGKKIQKVAEV